MERQACPAAINNEFYDRLGEDWYSAFDHPVALLRADTLEALGLKRGEYVVKLNSRKLLDGVLERCNLTEAVFADKSPHRTIIRIIVLRAIDKLDRLGPEGVRELLGIGRKDESGDFTKGAGLNLDQTNRIMSFTEIAGIADTAEALNAAALAVQGSKLGESGVEDLNRITSILVSNGYGRIRF